MDYLIEYWLKDGEGRLSSYFEYMSTISDALTRKDELKASGDLISYHILKVTLIYFGMDD